MKLRPQIANSSDDWSTLSSLLPPWQAHAQSLGLLKRTSEERLWLIIRLVLMHVGMTSSLKSTTALAYAGDVVEISSVSLHERMKQLGPLFAAMLADMCNTRMAFSPATWAGYDIRIVDASVVSRPGAPGTTARIHVALRLADLQYVHIDVTDEHGGETFKRFRACVKAGQLWIGDRGYANSPGIAAITSEGGDVLVRYNRGSLPVFDAQGQQIDVPVLCTSLGDNESPQEWPAWVHAQGGKRIAGRLVAVRLPADKTEEARARLRREYGNKTTEASLAFAEFVVLFTTVPSARMSAAVVLALYTLRWQVELSFKRDKSLGDLDRLPNFRADTIYTWLVASMLIGQIAAKLATQPVAFFPTGPGNECHADDGYCTDDGISVDAVAVGRRSLETHRTCSSNNQSGVAPFLN